MDLGIDHRLITPGYIEANGLAERIVQVLKKALRKYVLMHGVAACPEYLPAIEFGYRTTPHRSTGFSPYFLVYGRQPTYPAQIKAMLDGALVYVTSDAAMFLLITIRVCAVMLNAKWKRAETLVLRGINLSYTAMRETTIYYVGLQPLAVS